MAKQTNQKLADTKQYCLYLIDPPKASEKAEYKTWAAEKFYNCALHNGPCVARCLEDRTDYADIFSYARPKIDEGRLKQCPLCDIPVDVAKQTIVAKITAERDREIADLEKRIEGLK